MRQTVLPVSDEAGSGARARCDPETARHLQTTPQNSQCSSPVGPSYGRNVSAAWSGVVRAGNHGAARPQPLIGVSRLRVGRCSVAGH